MLLSSSSTTPVVNYAGPGTAGYQTLSNYCFLKATPGSGTATTSQWTLEVELRDAAGGSVTATRKFWVYDP